MRNLDSRNPWSSALAAFVPAAILHVSLLAACGDAFTASESSDAGTQGQAGQSMPTDASGGGTGGGSASDRVVPGDSLPSNANARIHCSANECNPGPERCCMLASAELSDYCFGGVGQPVACMSDKATFTVLECDDADDCTKAGKPATVCCARARSLDIQPGIPVWAAISCVAPSSCVKADDDIFCSSDAQCPPGKTCTTRLGPYSYCTK